MIRFLFLWLMILATWPVTPATGRAQADGDARRDFERAVQLYEDGRYATAAAVFEELLARHPSAELRFNAFRARLNAGDLEVAAEHLRSYIADAPESPETQRLRNQLRQIERRVEESTEQSTEQPTDHATDTNAQPPGRSAPAADVDRAAPATVPQEGSSGPSAWVTGGLVASAGLVVAGAVLGAFALSERSTLADACSKDGPPYRCPPSEDGRITRLAALSIGADVAFVMGGGLALVSLWLLVAERAEPEPATRIDARIGPEGAALHWGAAF